MKTFLLIFTCKSEYNTNKIKLDFCSYQKSITFKSKFSSQCSDFPPNLAFHYTLHYVFPFIFPFSRIGIGIESFSTVQCCLLIARENNAHSSDFETFHWDQYRILCVFVAATRYATSVSISSSRDSCSL